MSVTILSAALLMAGLTGMLGSLAWVIRKGNNNNMTRAFAGCQVSVILWLVSQLLILFSSDETQLWISYFIGNIGISFFSPLWLLFSAEYAEEGKNFSRYARLLPLISVSAICLVAANPFHRLYYGYFGTDRIEYAPLFYVYQVVYYICIISGITIICTKHVRQYDHITKPDLMLILSAVIPLAVNTLSITNIVKSRIELTPLFFALSSIFILVALGRYGLLNVNAIAMHETIDNIHSGVIIFDMNGMITFRNRYASELFGMEKIDSLGGFIRAASELSGTELSSIPESAELRIGSDYYDIRQSFCKNRAGTRVARVITINSLTEYHELAETEKKLSIEQERNRIAQEIHDSAGHTFTVISSLARVLHLELEKGTAANSEMLRQISDIDGLSRSGITQLRCSINDLRNDEFMTSVTKAVQTLLNTVRGIDTELSVQGTEDERYSFCIREMYDNCRETITNAMRYSAAERIDVILKFLGSRVEMFILDNGRGCAEITENNGLRGIRQRTEALGGSVRFTSVEGEGFTTIIRIPVKEDEK